MTIKLFTLNLQRLYERFTILQNLVYTFRMKKKNFTIVKIHWHKKHLQKVIHIG